MEVIKCITRDSVGDSIVVNNIELEIEKIKYIHANSGVNITQVSQTYVTTKSRFEIDTLVISYACDCLMAEGTTKVINPSNALQDLPFQEHRIFAYIPKDIESAERGREEVAKLCPYNNETLGKYLLCTTPTVNPDAFVYEIPVYYCKSEILPENTKKAEDVYFVIPSFTINKKGKLVHKGYRLFSFAYYRKICAISEDALEVGKEIKRLRF